MKKKTQTLLQQICDNMNLINYRPTYTKNWRIHIYNYKEKSMFSFVKINKTCLYNTDDLALFYYLATIYVSASILRFSESIC